MNIQHLYQRLINNQLVKDSFWSLLGNVVGRGLSLVAGILIARMLGKDIFGEYGIIKTTILTIGTFSTFGLGYTATKYVAEFKKQSIEKIPLFLKVANQITLGFSGAMALLLFFFSETVASAWLEAPHLAIPLKILSVLIVFNAITTTQVGVLSGFGCFKEIAKINSWMGLLTFLFSVLLTYFYELNGALLALLIVQIINCVLNFLVVKRETAHIGKNSKTDKAMLKSVLQFSTPIALQEAVYSVTSWLSSLLLIKFSTYGELGMYSAAMQWNAIVLFIPGILRNVVLSHLAKNSTDKVVHNNILRQTIVINFASTFIPCSIVIVISPWISTLYGQSFEGLAILISIAVFATLFQGVSNIYSQAFMSINKNWLMLGMRFLRDVGLPLSVFLLYQLGGVVNAFWLLIAFVFTQFIFLIASVFFYNSLFVR